MSFISRDRRMLALRLGRQRVCGAILSIRPSDEVRIEHSFSWLPPPASSSDNESWLIDRLSGLPDLPGSVAVVLSGDEAAVRHFALPSVPDSELEKIVQLQIASQLANTGEEFRWVQSAGPASDDGRQAIAVGVKRQTLEQIVQLCERRRRRLACVSVASAAHAALVSFTNRGSPSVELVVSLTEDCLEVIGLRDGKTVVALRSGIDAAAGGLSGALKRALVFASRRLGADPIERVSMIADPARRRALRDCLAEAGEPAATDVSLDTLRCRPVTGLLETEQLELIGVALLAAQRRPQMNFVADRVTHRAKRRVFAAAAVAGATALLFLTIFCWRSWSERRKLNWALEAEVVRLDAELAKLASELKRSKAIEKWANRDTDWQDILSQLAQPLHRQNAFLDQLSLERLDGRRGARARGKGRASTDAGVQELLQSLVDSRRFRVRARPPTRDPGDAEYPFVFQLDGEYQEAGQ